VVEKIRIKKKGSEQVGWLLNFCYTFNNIVLCDAPGKKNKTREEAKRKTFLYLIINLK
jgi:hypothetical protein